MEEIDQPDVKEIKSGKIGIDPVEYYLMLDDVRNIFTQGRRISHAILIWYGEDKDEKEDI